MRRLAILLFILLLSPAALAQFGFNIVEASITDLQRALSNGEVTSVQLVQAYQDRITAYDQQGPQLNSIIRMNPAASEDAARLDAERQAGQLRGPLHGIPVVVKDNYNTRFMATTGGSVALADFIPNANATQVDKLLDAGAIIIAKTNLHEYAYGITTVSSLRGQTRNPYDPRRVPGGSSGGTAAAVAASFAAVGMGSDTCGSIRIPSAFNNLVGLRPSKGLSSIYGIMPLSHTQDVAGPLARTTRDLAIVLDVVSGFDARDPATALVQDRAVPGFEALLDSVAISQLRLGRLTSYFQSADGQVRRSAEQALDRLAAQGAQIIDVEIDNLGELVAASGVIGHEFKPDLNQYLTEFESGDMQDLADIVSQGLYHEAVQGALQRSQAATGDPDAYAAALAARQALRQAVEAVLEANNLDALVYPPIADMPVMIGSGQPGNNCSLSANAGLPALSMPVGFSSDGLPVGLELLGGLLQDAHLLAIGHAWEQFRLPRQTPFVTPPLVDGRAPDAQTVAVDFQQGELHISGAVTVDRIRNQFNYSLRLAPDSSAGLSALTLFIDTDAVPGFNEPVLLNLMGPQQTTAQGSYFMSPEFRQAFFDRKIYMRVFAPGLAAAGATQNLRPD